MIYYHIGGCPVCGKQGKAELLFDTATNKIIAVCDECDLEFSSVSEYRNGQGRRASDIQKACVRSANTDEIKDTEWYPYARPYKDGEHYD